MTIKETVLEFLKEKGVKIDPVLTCNNTPFIYDIGKIEVRIPDDVIRILYVEDFIFSEEESIPGYDSDNVYRVYYDKPYVENSLGDKVRLNILEVKCFTVDELETEEMFERFDSWCPQIYPDIFGDIKEKIKRFDLGDKLQGAHFLNEHGMEFFIKDTFPAVLHLLQSYYQTRELNEFSETCIILLDLLTTMMMRMKLPVKNLWLDFQSNCMIGNTPEDGNLKYHTEEILEGEGKRLQRNGAISL